MIGLLLALAAAVFYQTSRQDSFLSSVSAYYYTPAQAIFVGALIGLGVSMIALQGMNGAEDTFLNLGGIFAIVVAIVPTGRGADFQTAVQACRESGGTLLTQRASANLDCPTVQALQEATRANVENNTVALLIVGGLGLILSGVILFRDRTAGTRAERRWALAGFLAAGAVWLLGLIALAVSVDWLAANGHYIAAGGLLAAILLVAGANAYRRGGRPAVKSALKSPRDYYYTWVAIAMLAVAAVLIALWLAGVISLFWVEILVALLFIVFWAVQTVELAAAEKMTSNHDRALASEIAALRQGQPLASVRPMRACSRRSGAGAYQAARPSMRWQAGTRTARTSVASMITANPAPMPNSCRKLTVAVAKAKKLTAISAAAAVTMRPLRVSPSVTAVRLSRPRSCSSLMRLSTMTS
jgi:hypothetical protein